MSKVVGRTDGRIWHGVHAAAAALTDEFWHTNTGCKPWAERRADGLPNALGGG